MLAALSLRVQIDDLEENPIYSYQSGIQILMKRRGPDLIPIPAPQILTDVERNAAAVTRALAELRNRTGNTVPLSRSGG